MSLGCHMDLLWVGDGCDMDVSWTLIWVAASEVTVY